MGRGPTSEVRGLFLQRQSACVGVSEANKLPLVVQDEERMPETCSFVCGHVGSSPPPLSTSVDIDITHVINICSTRPSLCILQAIKNGMLGRFQNKASCIVQSGYMFRIHISFGMVYS